MLVRRLLPVGLLLRTLAFSLGVLALSVSQAQATTVTFTDPNGLGSCSNWMVPAGVSAVRITATGTAGYAGMRVLSPGSQAVPSGTGGLGGVVSGTLSGLTPGGDLYVCVDQGSGGGGPDPDGGGGGPGGGASGVALLGSPSVPVLIAGGGGGGGDGGQTGSDQPGGNAGLPDGGPGADAPAQPGARGGGGGSQTQGGAGGAGDPSPACGGDCGPGKPGTGFNNNTNNGAPGTGGFGGQIITISGGGGGGGGGGYYGGGGGGSGAVTCTNCGHSGGAGGGGGSDFCATALPGLTLSGCAATGSNSQPSFTTAFVVLTYPVAPPTVSIAAPANGASYVQGQAVSSSFSCDDGAGGSWLVSCVDQNGGASGSPLDTSTLGSHTLTVTATTRDGMTGTSSVTYQVLSSGSGGAGGGGGSGGAFPGVKLHPGTFAVHNGNVKISVTCPPGQLATCVGTDTLSTLKAVTVTVSVRHKHKPILGSARFSIPAGQTKVLTIKLNNVALKLLTKYHNLLVLETVVAQDSTGQSKTTSTTITLKRPATRR